MAVSLEQVQDQLVDDVCGPRWLPMRALPPHSPLPGVRGDAGLRPQGQADPAPPGRHLGREVRLQLATVGCRDCGRVFAPLRLMLDLTGRRTDRLAVDLVELISQKSFARAGAVAHRFGVPDSAGRAHQAVADIAQRRESVGRVELGGPSRAAVVVLDGTGVRAGRRRLRAGANVALGLTARSPRRARTELLGLTVDQPLSAMATQLADLEPPVMVVVDGEIAMTRAAELTWPDTPIQLAGGA